MKIISRPCILIFVAISCLSAIALSPATAEEMRELQYRGTLSNRKRGEDPELVKTFGLLALVESSEQNLDSLFWRVEDTEGWQWPESFGWSVSAAGNQPARSAGLLYQYDNVPWPIPLPPLYLTPDQRKSGKSWTVDRRRYEVQEGSEKFQDQPSLTVLVNSNFGRAQKLQYDPATGLLQQAEIKLFLGRGDEFAMTLKRADANLLSETVRGDVRTSLGHLAELQKELARDPDAVRPELSAQQIAVVETVLPKLDEVTENTPLQPLTIEIHRDLKTQQERSSSIEKLAAQQIGQTAPELDLTLLNGDPLPSSELEDQVIVLHFWKYHDDPIQEPYGQIGYLDFLDGKRGKLGVKFLGVAVNPEFADPKASRRMMLNVKKLVKFMNVGYDIVRDNGSLLKQFGDPRESGAKLPLWVVIGADGKIRHYKVGFYSVNPREGLKELDEAIIAEIKARRAAKNNE
ncbi:MAG: TlpA family protein disulfide reductase [Planctomycetaceae bacterium]|nr:TlpA family protein disulfide reductase [Planctomycetaceae bacterium]